MSQAAQELLLGGYVNYQQFETLIASFTRPPDVLLLLEKQPTSIVRPEQRQALLIFSQFTGDVPDASYTSGRIFHPQGELRWEKQKDRIQLVYTGDSAFAPVFQHEKKRFIDAHNSVVRSYFLLGKRLGQEQMGHVGPEARADDFAEVRIPRLLRYPTLPTLAGADRIKIAVREYIDATTGLNIAYRFQALVPHTTSHRQEKA